MPSLDITLTVPPGGLIAWTLAASPALPSQDARLSARILALLDACHDSAAPWPFRENPDPGGPHTMETLTWALVCLQHLGAEDRIAAVRDRPGLLDRIDAYYDPDLMIYRDDNTQEVGRIGAWRFHNDSVMRMGLQIMGAPARPQVTGLAMRRHFPWAPQSDAELEGWMQRCWDHDPRAGVKEIVQYLRLYRMLAGPALDEHLLRILGFLAAHRDPATGYIGIPKSGDLGWAMRGHRNNILHTWMDLGLREPPDAALAVMRSTLALQRPDGLFHDGSMCANMDAIELLAEYHLQTGCLRDEALGACRRCVAGLFARLYVAPGGFVYAPGTLPADPAAEGHGRACLVNGAAFALNTLRYWAAIDPLARHDLPAALDGVGAKGILKGQGAA